MIVNPLSDCGKNRKWSCRDLDGADQLEKKEDDLNTTYDRESSEESHGASDEAQLGLRLDLLVLLNVVEGCRVKVDLHQLKD